jgi:hypothetical protein
MEQNNPTPAAETNALPPLPASTPAATNPGTATKVASNKPLLIGGAIALVAVIAAIVIGVVLLTRPSAPTVGAGNGLNASNPTAATNTINTLVKDTVQKAANSDTAGLTSMFAPLANLKAADFKLTFNMVDSSNDLKLTFTGRSAAKDNNEGALDGTLNIAGNVPSLGQLNADVQIIIADKENLYFQLKNLPPQLSAQLVLVGLSENKWYYLPMSKLGGGNVTSDPLSLANIDTAELKEAAQELQNKPLFVNPKSVANRTVLGENIPCMEVQINPEFNTSSTSNVNAPIEICNGNNALPVFFGTKMDQSGSKIDVGLELNQYKGGDQITAPSGATDASFLLSMLGGAGL